MKIAALMVALAGVASGASAAVSFTGTTYTQNFDTLLNAPATGNAFANDTTIVGWHLFKRTSNTDATPVPAVTYNAGTGSSNGGNFYSFGATGSSERSFGGVGSSSAPNFGGPSTGAVAGWLAVSFNNDTGTSLNQFTIGFDGEQWRDGGAATPVAQTMVLEYGFGSSFNAVTTWIAPGGTFNFASPVFANTGSGVAVDGNVAGLVAGLGGSVNSIAWNPGETLWVRWIENNDTGNDHGLSIDNLTFNAIPTPGAMALLGLAGLVAGRRKR
jgi:hypothetical protein